MKKSVDMYLQDIITSNKLIQKRIKNKTQETFESNLDLQDMVIHRLEIIGEAVKNLPPSFRDDHPEVPWHRPAGMRDKLIHAYDAVDLTIVWDTATRALPPFIEQVRKLLEIVTHQRE